MPRIGLWSIAEHGPQRLEISNIALESYLQDWVETDPDLLQTGLVIVGRELQVSSGRVDLLGIDPQGRWVVIEFKSGILDRLAVAQAVDYASCVASMPFAELAERVDGYLGSGDISRRLEPLLSERQATEAPESTTRDVVMLVVGTGLAPGLERMVQYLSTTCQVPISLVTYHVFETSSGTKVLARELTDVDAVPQNSVSSPLASLDDILRAADRGGTRPSFDVLLSAAERHGLHPRPYRKCLMFAPPSHRGRCLYTIWIQPAADGRASLYVSPRAFAEFFPVDEKTATAVLGPEGYRYLSHADLLRWVDGLDELFAATGQSLET